MLLMVNAHDTVKLHVVHEAITQRNKVGGGSCEEDKETSTHGCTYRSTQNQCVMLVWILFRASSTACMQESCSTPHDAKRHQCISAG